MTCACESEAGRPCECEPKKLSLWELDNLSYKEKGEMDMKNQDSYGSTIRDAMKKSMAEPYQSLNRRTPQEVPVSMMIAVFIGVLGLGIIGWYLFNAVEQLFR